MMMCANEGDFSRAGAPDFRLAANSARAGGVSSGLAYKSPERSKSHPGGYHVPGRKPDDPALSRPGREAALQGAPHGGPDDPQGRPAGLEGRPDLPGHRR